MNTLNSKTMTVEELKSAVINRKNDECQVAAQAIEELGKNMTYKEWDAFCEKYYSCFF